LAEGWPVDLDKLEARLSGTILHAAMAQVDPETAEIAVAGSLFGHEIVGSVDRLEDDGMVTVDYKTSEGSTALPDKPYQEQAWQQETYRHLLAQHEAYTLGWKIFYKKAGRPWACFEHIGPVQTEAQLCTLRPHGGAFTTRELAEQCASGVAAASLPLVGATMKMGRGTVCEYCELQTPCNEKGYQVEL
jgi:hypothetical protein